MELADKIIAVLNTSGIKIYHFDFECTATGNIGGILISEVFHDMDETARQELVWSKLKVKLTEDERGHIVSLITVTPVFEGWCIVKLLNRSD